MILRVRHATRYTCEPEVTAAAHLLHLRPRSLASQRLHHFRLTADPPPSRQRDGVDHFGNPVTWLFHDFPHSALDLVTDSVVEVRLRPVVEDTPPWEHVAEAARSQAAAWRDAEFAFPSPFVPALAGARALAAPCFPPTRPVAEGAFCLARRIGETFRFEAGATTISTPLARVIAQRAGVCQDFAHLMIAGLRSLGLPARYMTGYLLTHPPPGCERLRGADRSHAWVGCWAGPGHGWLEFDPTNSAIVRDEHVCLGWGRDYGDVSPTRGVLLGGGTRSLHIAVDVEPVAADIGR